MHKAKHRKIKAKVTAPSPSKLTGKIKQKHIEKSWLEKKKKLFSSVFPVAKYWKKKRGVFSKKGKRTILSINCNHIHKHWHKIINGYSN